MILDGLWLIKDDNSKRKVPDKIVRDLPDYHERVQRHKINLIIVWMALQQTDRAIFYYCLY